MSLLRNGHEVIAYLLERRLLRSEHIVDDTLRVWDASRRNRNYKVVCNNGPSFVLKQAEGPSSIVTLGREAAVYRFFKSVDNGTLARYLPRFHHYDEANHILVVPVISGSESMVSYHGRRGQLSVTLARALGKALAALHMLTRTGPVPRLGSHVQPLSFPVCWPNMATYLASSWASLEFLRILQESDDLCDWIDRVRMKWEPQVLFHGDMRLDNCIVYGNSSPRPTRILLVDWEFAGIGDAWWDIGAVLAEYLSFWLNSIPVGGDVPAACAVGLAGHRLRGFVPAIRAFWQAYKRSLPGECAPTSASIVNAVEFGAVRLVQIGFEQSQLVDRVTAKAVALLQLAYNILRRPREAAVQLLGFDLREVYP
jgi:Phosphotransferase enzyme family